MYKFEDFSQYIDDPYTADISLQAPTPGEAVDIRRRILQYERELPQFAVDEILYVPWTVVDFKSGHYVPVTKTLSSANQIYRDTDIEKYSQTVYDLRMGTVGREVCATCGRSSVNCIGHMGYIELHRKIIHPLYFRTLIRILRSVQLDPPPSGHRAAGGKGQLLVNSLRIENELRNLHGMQRLIALEKMSKTHKAGSKQKYYQDRQNTKEIKSKWSQDLPGVVRYTIGNSKTEYMLSMDQLEEILEAISPETSKELGLLEILHPRDFLVKFIPVIPNTSRPPLYKDGKQEPNDLTIMYDRIVDLNNTYSAADDAEKNKIMTKIFGYYNDIIFGKKDAVNSKKKMSVAEKTKGKHGLIRENLEASRVNFGARSVVTPNPKLAFDEVSLPETFRSKLTRTIWVDEKNYQEINDLIRKGQVTHLFRGERIIPLSRGENPEARIGDKVYRWLQEGDYVLINRNPTIHKTSFLALRATFNPGKTIQINLPTTVPLNADFDGDELNVHVIQSDLGYEEARELICINKHIIDYQNNRVLTGLSYDYPVAAYMLTSPETFVSRQLYNICLGEIEGNPALLSLQKRLIEHGVILVPPEMPRSPLFDLIKENNLLYSSQLLNYLQTDDSVGISQTLGIANISEFLSDNTPELREYLRWVQNEENWRTVVEYPGRALFSALLPENFQYRKGSVVIRDGILVDGVISKSDIGSTSNNIIQQLYVNHGEDVAVQFMSNAMHMLGRWFDSVGFSIGVDDCYVMSELERSNVVSSDLQRIEDEITKLGIPPRTPAENRLYENKITEIIGGADRAWNRILKDIISRKPNMMEIARMSGAKGSVLNITNISLGLGQQKHYGQRIGFSLSQQTRCLPYFVPNDVSPSARGYCLSSFAKGLEPHEFIFHGVVSREGLLDTTSNTADTGDLHRRTNKLLYNIMVFADGTTRNYSGGIVQFMYGYDNYEPRELQAQKIGQRTVNFFINYRSVAEMLNREVENS